MFAVKSHPDYQWQAWDIPTYNKAKAIARQQSQAYPNIPFLIVDRTGWVWNAFRNGKVISDFLPYQLPPQMS